MQNILVGGVDDHRLNGVAVGRRSGHDRQIARPEKRELKRSRNGGGGQREGIDIHFERLEFLLYGHTEFLLFVDNEQAQIFPFYGLSYKLVRADEDIDLAVCEVGENVFRLLGCLCATEVFHPHGEILESLAERVVMLKREHGSGHQYSRLLVVASRFESRPHRNLRLAETHIAADKSIHRHGALHIVLEVDGGFSLVGGVFVKKRCLELVLHITVSRECKPFLCLARGI